MLKNVHLLQSPEEERTDVYINGNRISAIGREPRGFSADETIDCSGKTAMPGFINCHTHAYMSLMRNYADDVPFATWLFDRILPIEDSLTLEEAYWGNLLSIAEMIRSGTTTFVDMQMFPRMAVKACADTGMRALITRGLVGSDRHDEGAKTRIAQAFDEMDYGTEIYTCGEDLLRYVAELAHDKNLPVHLHLAETQQEFDDCMNEHGMSPAAYVDSLGLLDGEILLAHCVYLDDNDFSILARPHVHVVTNPASNMKLANGFAPVTRMLREGIHVALGTDSAASNNALNMFTEMRLLSMSQKGVTRDALALTAEETLRIATENGAAAIGREDLGSIEVGKTADLILIDEDCPSLRPLYNRKASLVYSASGSEVSDVMIDGKWVMRERHLKTIDEERVIYETEKIAAKYR